MITPFFRTISVAALCLACSALPLHAHAQAGAHQASSAQRDAEPYALVRDGQRTTYVGSHSSDDPEVAALGQQYAGNFIWLRQSGKAYVVRDPFTLAEVAAAWAPTEKLQQEMTVFDVRMRAHSAAMTALGRDMTVATRAAKGERSDTEAIARRMDAQGQTMDALGKQIGALGKRIEAASRLADASSRSLLRAALANGAAQPVPPTQ